MKNLTAALLGGIAFGVLLSSGALPQTASLLPNGQQQFTDGNGAPLGAGKVKFCVPNTNCAQLAQTWKDPNQSTLNTNPVVLDAGGRATIFGAGAYEQQVFDVFGNLVWDKLTYGVNPSAGNVLSALAPGSLVGNGGGVAGPASAVTVSSPLVIVGGTVTSLMTGVLDNHTPVGLSSADNGKQHLATAGASVYYLPAISSVGNGYYVWIYNQSGSPLQVTPQGNDSFYGVAAGQAYSLPNGNAILVSNNGQGFGAWLPFISGPTLTAPVHFPGEVIKTRATACPAGSVYEDGSALSRTDYASLFSALGVFWGAGNGSTTFNIPDSRGYFDRNLNSATSGIDFSRGVGSKQLDQFQGHQFTFQMGAGVNNASGQGTNNFNFNSPATTTGPVSDGVNGTPRVGSETRPVNVAVLSCIWTGLAP